MGGHNKGFLAVDAGAQARVTYENVTIRPFSGGVPYPNNPSQQIPYPERCPLFKLGRVPEGEDEESFDECKSDAEEDPATVTRFSPALRHIGQRPVFFHGTVEVPTMAVCTTRAVDVGSSNAGSNPVLQRQPLFST